MMLFASACADNTFSAPVRSQPLQMGVSVHQLHPAVLKWVKDAGIPWVRVTNYYQSSADPGYVDMFLAQMDTLHSYGLKVSVVFHTAPADDPDGLKLPAYMADMVRRGKLDAVELYNEENAPGWRPVLNGSNDFERGQDYAGRYTAAHDAIHGMVPLLMGGTATMPEDFLLGMKSKGVTPDIIAFHAYGYPPVSYMDMGTRTAHKVYPGVPVWINEVGSEGGAKGDTTTNKYDDVTQTLDMQGMLVWLQLHSEVRVFWYVMADDWGYSLLRPDFTERPAATILRQNGPYR